jgi:integrase
MAAIAANSVQFRVNGTEMARNFLLIVHLLSNVVPMEEVSKLLGHTSIVTTERHYAAWATARQDRVDALVIGTWK